MTWEIQLKESVRTIKEASSVVNIPSREMKRLAHVVERHPMCVPPYYLSLIDPDDPNDPVKAMAVPSVDELNLMGSYDTSGEKDNTKMPGLQHKYPQTALILSTNRCAMYCRHCFRKRLVGLPNHELLQRFDDAAAYVRQHREINNVLITGGDPFVLDTSMIARFLEMLSDIGHLSFIRFGTRIPVTLPHRITHDPDLIRLLKKHSLPQRRIYVVTQFNHPREITEEAVAAVDCLIRSGVLVNNQTVLLNGVNDDPAILAALQNNLAGIGINPYYIFQCRPVKRVQHHFQVPLHQGYDIVEAAKGMLNGHSKRFRFIMSHRKGKIEIVGRKHDEIFFKFHQARNPANTGKFFSRHISPGQGWLADTEEIAPGRVYGAAS
ncbi:MAG: KamA family radical SAM protein [Deltaproteobacteria bacterium]|jgi:KamA family protein|nr:KamA family radical SAM protein [Deltaproteobacteria bacterium]MDX9761571.1 KamA family radical SAM protein [Desulfomonilia bacterium]HPW68494.1 KamA family radical SAM protein [Deltaproteobacteria bacterium]